MLIFVLHLFELAFLIAAATIKHREKIPRLGGASVPKPPNQLIRKTNLVPKPQALLSSIKLTLETMF